MEMIQPEPSVQGEQKVSRKVTFPADNVPVLCTTPVEKWKLSCDDKTPKGIPRKSLAGLGQAARGKSHVRVDEKGRCPKARSEASTASSRTERL